MPTTDSPLHRVRQWFASKPAAPLTVEPAQNPPVVKGIYTERGQWRLCNPDAVVEGRTVYLVTIGKKLAEEYRVNLDEYAAIQETLENTPRSLRPRRRKVADG